MASHAKTTAKKKALAAFSTSGGAGIGSGLLPGVSRATVPVQTPQALAAAAAAARPATPNGDVSTPGDVDPRDSTYGAGLAALLGQIQAQRQAVEQAQQVDHQGYDENMPRIAANRALSLKNTNVNANKQGLFYSGILGQRQGQVNGQYDDQVNSETSALAARDSARQAQLQQLGNLTADPNSPYGYSATGGAGLDFYNLLRDAADRRTAQAANAAPAPTQVDASASMAAPGASAPLNHTGPTARLPVYSPTTPAPAGRLGGVASAWNKPKAAPKPRAPIHGFSTVTLRKIK